MASYYRVFLLLSLIVINTAPAQTQQGKVGRKIKHVVLLMEENRSFDHMLGFYPGVNGLKGTETNAFNTSDPNSPKVQVNNTSPYIGPFDPNHSTGPTTKKIFGQKCLQEQCNVPTMSGFVEFEASRHSDPSSVMNMFTPDRVPITSSLADEFVVFDRFFCSHPGPTWPNRLFQLMATSEGDTETSVFNPNTTLYTGKTIFDLVEEGGHDWAFYFADAPLEMSMIKKVLDNPEKVHDWKKFKEHIRSGALPAFSWVNPRWFVNETTAEGANDDHPDHDVRLGQALMKEIYEELRASPAWENTMFIITYDEHGGFYDHVAPPMGVPAPDNSPSFPDEGFKFDRLGVRIPVLAISPWLPKGHVEHRAQGPYPTSEYDATSIISTVKALFAPKSDFLSKRDAWAGTFDHLLLDTPRTDCPTHLPAAPKSLGAAHASAEAAQPLNDLQHDIVKAFAYLRGSSEMTDQASLPTLQGEGSAWLQRVVAEIKNGYHVFAS